MSDLERLIDILRERSVRRERVVLASGRESDFYVDARQTTLHAEGSALIAKLVLERLKPGIAGVGGPVTGADPIAGAVAALSHLNGNPVHGFMVRKEPKGHGLKLWVEGRANLPDGAKVCMVEDTVTTGGSLIRAIERVEENGLVVDQIIVIVDREEGAKERLAEAGYEMEALTGRRALLGEYSRRTRVGAGGSVPTPAFHADRRRRLAAAMDRPVLLLGNGTRPRNLPMTELPFRQDSTFLYFTGCSHPNAALLLDGDRETLFLPPPAEDDALWHGHVETLADKAGALGFDAVRPVDELANAVGALAAPPASLAVPDARRTDLARRLTGATLEFGRLHGDDALVDAVIQLRRITTPDEREAMRSAARITDLAHRAVMAGTRPGRHERELRALFEAVLTAAGHAAAYDPILTVRGEVLHNFHAVNRLEAGQLLLLDGGAESPAGYATDVTRTWPVSGRFDARQYAAYDAVLEAQLAAIDMVRPGVRYRDIHMTASRVLAAWLVDEGLLRGAVDDLVEAGAHALFFPHGVGHLIGLDVHDLENFGDRPAYQAGRTRSPQFGTGYLRLDIDLEPGMVVTIEPGFYVVPAILADQELTGRFGDMVDLDKARSWAGFGGIRIEDDVAVTDGDPDVLTDAIPKSPEALEALVGTGGLLIPDGLA